VATGEPLPPAWLDRFFEEWQRRGGPDGVDLRLRAARALAADQGPRTPAHLCAVLRLVLGSSDRLWSMVGEVVADIDREDAPPPFPTVVTMNEAGQT